MSYSRKIYQMSYSRKKWWGETDSNRRTLREQIYSLPRLASFAISPSDALELTRGLEPPT